MVKAQHPAAIMEDIVAGLETAWNNGDGAAFAGYFAENADFVNVYGMHSQGREAIAQAHDRIFRTVYAGSIMASTARSVRLLADDVVLVHLNGHRSPVPSMLHLVHAGSFFAIYAIDHASCPKE